MSAGNDDLNVPLPDNLDALIDAFGEAQYECGEWTDQDDNDFEAVYAAALQSRAALTAAIHRALKESDAQIDAPLAGPGKNPNAPESPSRWDSLEGFI